MVVDGMPETHGGMPIWLNNLSILLENRYKWTHRSADLDKATVIQRKVLRLSPKGHAAIPGCLNNLAVFLHYRFEHPGDLGDLSDAFHIMVFKFYSESIEIIDVTVTASGAFHSLALADSIVSQKVCQNCPWHSKLFRIISKT